MSEIYHKIGNAARLVGMTTRQVRFYCNKGLLSPIKTQAGYRLFGLEDIMRLRLIRSLRTFDTPVEAIRAVLSGHTSIGFAMAEREVRAASTFRSIQRQLIVLEAMKELPQAPQHSARPRWSDATDWINQFYALCVLS